MLRVKTIQITLTLAFLSCLFWACAQRNSAAYCSDWPSEITRTYIGPRYWANRLQDWKLANGRVECVFSGRNRSLALLTHELGEQTGDFELRVRFGFFQQNDDSSLAWAGFRIGAKGRFNDYRDTAVHGEGLGVGVTPDGRFVWDDSLLADVPGFDPSALQNEGIDFEVQGQFDDGTYQLKLTVFAADSSGALAQITIPDVADSAVVGGLALVSDFPQNKLQSSTWFADWRINGGKIAADENRQFGPILFSQYTLSKNILKMTAQMPPIGASDARQVILELQRNGDWQPVDTSSIDEQARTASFRVENWQGDEDAPYRIVYDFCAQGQRIERFFYQGTIRHEPLEKETLVMAAFSCNNDLGFPHGEVVRNVAVHKPDLLFFSGDQIYEGVGGFGVQRAPFEPAALDYLRKWYLFGWAFADLMRDRPTITITDDHDVYHGNVWGESGKATKPGTAGADAQDSGGYKMFPQWVRLVERTQTSHLPDPFDPTPVQQGIGVYYCDLNYAGVSFAILEDRKFKSAPKALLPEAQIWNGWPQNPQFDARTQADVAGAQLLGQRQLHFLRQWAADWRDGIWMKAVLSQTIFTNLATLPVEAKSGAIIPSLPILKPGEFAQNEKIVHDFDSNGWPQSQRNAALSEIRKAFAIHVAGDQHLGSTVHYGIDDWRDAGTALCVPAISNIWPRRWYPPIEGQNRQPGTPRYTGDFEDGFGNKMSVYAVANPQQTGMKPPLLYDRATGYGIVRFNRTRREITFENWPRWTDPGAGQSKPYAGWPITFRQSDNYARQPAGYLPELRITGMTEPVVQIVDEASGEIVYTLRIDGDRFRPMIYGDGRYSIGIGEQGTEKWQVLKGIAPTTDQQAVLVVEF